ncbi:MAG: AsnC family transcriptional regulator [Phycisphaerae bacterium]|nr:AsnC family transcriptional regulator [Phycisphaerae bacterium]
MQAPDDPIDRQLLDVVQVDFPLSARPFAELGARVGVDEAEALARITRLKAGRGPIRQVSAIFDSHTLGYDSTLAAAQVDPDRIEAAAEIICRHPGVSHCYERSHRYNLWYTLAVPPTSSLGLDRTLERLDDLSGAKVTRKFPTLRLFKIGVVLDLMGERNADSASQTNHYTADDRQEAGKHAITASDLPMIRALQTDIVIEPRPFDRLAEAAGCTVDELLEAARRMIERRQMRRYAAVLRHREAGFVANCMACWQVPDGEADSMGERLAGFDAVSHCYLRPSYDDWPYSIYTMIHGQSRQECLDVVEALRTATALAPPAVLWSTREFKKTRVRYFTGETEAWEGENRGPGFGVRGSG